MKKALVSIVLVCLLALFAGTAMAEGIVSLNKASVAELTAIEAIDVPEDIAQIHIMPPTQVVLNNCGLW